MSTLSAVQFQVSRRSLAEVESSPAARASSEQESLAPNPALIAIEAAGRDRLSEIERDWIDLVGRAHEPNVFMDPALLCMAGADVGGKRCVTLLAWQVCANDRKLVGLWAFSAGRLRRSIVPVRVLAAPAAPHAYLATPVIDRDVAEATLNAMLDFIALDPSLPKLIVADPMRTDGPTMLALNQVLDARSSSAITVTQAQRPILASSLDGKQYFEKALSSSSRKKLRQYRRRLEETGKLELAIASEAEAVCAAFDDFLQLEAAGWKGRGATALRSDPVEAALAKTMIRELAKRGNVAIHSLYLDGKPVSMQIVLRAGAVAFTWKTAYDETLHDYSPGTLLLEDYTKAFLADRSIAWVDSCALDDSGYMSAWSERETIAQVWVDARPGRSVALQTICQLQKTFLSLRSFAKAGYLSWRAKWKAH
jgi:CelD/BcsL family acetyltransferase involved in cellulose biosynthesis